MNGQHNHMQRDHHTATGGRWSRLRQELVSALESLQGGASAGIAGGPANTMHAANEIDMRRNHR